MENNYKNIREIIIKNPIYEFYGKIDSSKLKSIFKDVEYLIQNKGTKSFLKKSIYVLVELLNNTIKDGIIDSNIKFLLNISNNKLYFLCENKIVKENRIGIKKHLEHINILNDKELKELYKKILINSPLDEKSTRNGIWFINILRGSANKILYNFTEIDDKTTKVSLIATIDIK